MMVEIIAMDITRDEAESISHKLTKLVSSPAKYQILIDSQDGLATESFPGPYNYEEGTIIEKKDELIANDYLIEKNGELHCTDKAKHMVKQLEELIDAYQIFSKRDPFFDFINISMENKFNPPLEYFTNVKQITEDDDLDRSVKDRYASHLDSSEQLREVAPFPLGLDRPTEEAAVIRGDISCEYILSKNMYETLANNAHYRQNVFWKFSDAGHKWYVTDSLPYMLSIFDDVVMFVTRDEAKLKRALEIENEDMYNWAEKLYTNIKSGKETDKINIEKTEGNVEVDIE
jgi:predicted transcriptional regulator